MPERPHALATLAKASPNHRFFAVPVTAAYVTAALLVSVAPWESASLVVLIFPTRNKRLLLLLGDICRKLAGSEWRRHGHTMSASD